MMRLNMNELADQKVTNLSPDNAPRQMSYRYLVVFYDSHKPTTTAENEYLQRSSPINIEIANT